MDPSKTPTLDPRLRETVDKALTDSMKELFLTSALGLVLSLVGFIALGAVFYLAWICVLSGGGSGKEPLIDLPFPLILGIYTVVVAILILVGIWYRPRERYYFGVGSRSGHYDDPTTFRDDIDRLHATVGCLLVIPNFIRMNLVTLKDSIAVGGSRL